MRTALFLDFENTYTSLCAIDVAAAEEFASNPARWLAWLLGHLPAPPQLNGLQAARRRVLLRRCYLAPTRAYLREAFVEAGFEMIDCPRSPMTGKHSANIPMVIDMLEALLSDVRYDEFILVSADADFTPLLRRLRRADCRSTLLIAGPTAYTYESAADQTLDMTTMLSQVLKSAPVVVLPARQSAGRAACSSDADGVAELVIAAGLPLFGQADYRCFLRALAESLQCGQTALKLIIADVGRTCALEGAPIAASELELLVTTLLGTALDIRPQEWVDNDLASRLCDIVVARCHNAGHPVQEGDEHALLAWLTGLNADCDLALDLHLP